VVTQHQTITFLSGFQKDLLFFWVLDKFCPIWLFCFPPRVDAHPKAVGKVNRQDLQIIGITVETLKNTKVIVYFADINLVTDITGSC
jgi:hypothetical protein